MPPRFFVDLPLELGHRPDAAAGRRATCRCCACSPAPPSRCSTAPAASGRPRCCASAAARCRCGSARTTPVERELPLAVTLALGMPANERMDTLVEKATELGVAAIEPLICERSVLRLSGERAERRRAHWQGIAVAAAEQCGRTRLPLIGRIRSFAEMIDDDTAAPATARFVLSLRRATRGPGRNASRRRLSKPAPHQRAGGRAERGGGAACDRRRRAAGESRRAHLARRHGAAGRTGRTRRAISPEP